MSEHYIGLVDNLIVALEHSLEEALVCSEGEFVELLEVSVVVASASACPEVIGEHVLAHQIVEFETAHLEVACDYRISASSSVW